jgi:hypothetical protein
MYKTLRPILCDTFNRFGKPPELDKRRCKAILSDLAKGLHSFEIEKLLLVYDSEVLNNFIQYNSNTNLHDFLSDQLRVFQQTSQIKEDKSVLVVAIWASALGLGTDTDIQSWLQNPNIKKTVPKIISPVIAPSPTVLPSSILPPPLPPPSSTTIPVSNSQIKYMLIVAFFIGSFLRNFSLCVLGWVFVVVLNYMVGWLFWGWGGYGIKTFALFIAYSVVYSYLIDIIDKDGNPLSLIQKKECEEFLGYGLILICFISSKFDFFWSWFVLSILFSITEVVIRLLPNFQFSRKILFFTSVSLLIILLISNFK